MADDREQDPPEGGAGDGPEGPGPDEEAGGPVPARRTPTEGRLAAERVGETARAAKRGGVLQFIRECWAELGRVQWPNRSQLWQATAVVVIACLVVGIYLYALDSVFTRAAEWLIDQQAG